MSYKNPQHQRDYAKAHYQRNKDAYKARAKVHDKKNQAQIRAFILEYLQGHPCIDCGESNLIVLEFDHRNPSQKIFPIGAAITLSYSFENVKLEIKKCDVRCANCHRIKTYKERGFTNRTV